MKERKDWNKGQANAYPCKKDCPDRKLACHDTCKRYQDAKKADLEKKAMIRAKKNAEHEIKDYIVKITSKTTGKPIKSR